MRRIHEDSEEPGFHSGYRNQISVKVTLLLQVLVFSSVKWVIIYLGSTLEGDTAAVMTAVSIFAGFATTLTFLPVYIFKNLFVKEILSYHGEWKTHITFHQCEVAVKYMKWKQDNVKLQPGIMEGSSSVGKLWNTQLAPNWGIFPDVKKKKM